MPWEDVAGTARKLGQAGISVMTCVPGNAPIPPIKRLRDVAAIEIEGEDVRELGAAFRNCTTVFQHYALFPHMSVCENVAYGLRVRRVPLDEQKRRVE